jgi:hypothetical protein
MGPIVVSLLYLVTMGQRILGRVSLVRSAPRRGDEGSAVPVFQQACGAHVAMRSHVHDDRSKGRNSWPSQLPKVDELELRVCAITVVGVFCGTPAFAEVCDKVSSEWVNGEPPAGSLNLSQFAIMAAFLSIGLALVAFSRFWWLGYLGAAAIVMLAALLLHHALTDSVYAAAVREGCISALIDLGMVGVLLLFAIAYFWAGNRAKDNTLKRLPHNKTAAS